MLSGRLGSCNRRFLLAGTGLEATKRYLLDAARLVVPADRVLVYEVDATAQPHGHISSASDQYWGGLYARFRQLDPYHPKWFTKTPESVFGTCSGFSVEVENHDYLAGFRTVLGVRFKADVFLRDAEGRIRAGVRYARLNGGVEFNAEEMARLGIMKDLFSNLWCSALARAQQARILAGLSEREHETLELLTLGYQNRDIAAQLGIAVPTVKNHVKNILVKTGYANRSELLAALLRAANSPG